MGYFPKHSSYRLKGIARISSNPDPMNYVIQESKRVGEFLILSVLYRGCENFEGRKILVYEGINLYQLTDFIAIDPHFSDVKDRPSPIARFIPTQLGWERAIQFAEFLTKESQ